MKSVLSKLLFTYLLILIVAFGLLGLLLRQVFYPDYVQLMGHQLETRGEALAKEIAPLWKAGKQEELEKALQIARTSLGTEICLVDVGRNVVAFGSASAPGVKSSQETTCCPALSTYASTVTTREAQLTACGKKMVVATIPVISNASENPETLGVLLLRSPFDEIDAAARQLGNLILICATVGALAGLALATWLSGRISGPLRKMRSMAAQMAQGDLTARLALRGRDEIAQLAGSFNTMGEQLEISLARLQQESARLRGVLASMAEGVLAVDAHERILLANPQTLVVLNQPQRDLSGKTLGESELPEALTEAVRRCLSEKKMVGLEISTRPAKEGLAEAGRAALQVVPMLLGAEGPSGQEWGAVVVMRDVSEPYRLEQMRKRFFSDISHELRTPLTNITGYATALEDGTAADPRQQAQALSVILKESDRLRKFIEELLDLSRLESGQPALQKESCELAPIAKAAMESLEAMAKPMQVEMKLEMPENLPAVVADPNRVHQVFLNLLSNALRFNHPGGKVTILAEVREQELRVIVSDTGRGIAKEELPWVWERFHRAPEQISEFNAGGVPGGSGLGLAIVRGIIHAHGGSVGVESELGKGSTFWFTLPLG